MLFLQFVLPKRQRYMPKSKNADIGIKVLDQCFSGKNRKTPAHRSGKQLFGIGSI